MEFHTGSHKEDDSARIRALSSTGVVGDVGDGHAQQAAAIWTMSIQQTCNGHLLELGVFQGDQTRLQTRPEHNRSKGQNVQQAD